MTAKEKHTGKKDTEESQTQELKKVLHMDVGLIYVYLWGHMYTYG